MTLASEISGLIPSLEWMFPLVHKLVPSLFLFLLQSTCIVTHAVSQNSFCKDLTFEFCCNLLSIWHPFWVVWPSEKLITSTRCWIPVARMWIWRRTGESGLHTSLLCFVCALHGYFPICSLISQKGYSRWLEKELFKMIIPFSLIKT